MVLSPVPVCGVVFPHHQEILWHQLGVLPFSSSPPLSTGNDNRSHRWRTRSSKTALPLSHANSKSRLLTHWLQTEGSNNPSPWASLLSSSGPQNLNILLTRLPFYCKRIECGKSQTEEMHRARYGKKTQLPSLAQHAILPKSPQAHQPGTPLNPNLLGCMEALFTIYLLR